MKQQLEAILASAKKELSETKTARDLDAVRVKFLGKKGELTAILKGMKNVAPEERPIIGQLVNDVRAAVETALEQQSELIERAAMDAKLKSETLYVTMPIVTARSCFAAIASVSAIQASSSSMSVEP